jgi:hypothetical protein
MEKNRKDTRGEVLFVRIDPKNLRFVKDICKEKNLSMSNYINKVIEGIRGDSKKK